MKNSHFISDFNNLSLDELDKYFERKKQLEFDQECKLQEEYRKEGIIVESIRYLNNWINVDDTSYVICTSVIAEFIDAELCCFAFDSVREANAIITTKVSHRHNDTHRIFGFGEQIKPPTRKSIKLSIEKGGADKYYFTTIGDIIIAMFNHRATSSLFQPQELISVKDLKNVFYKFIEASEMTLKNDSMERLYDIMIMSFKQQIKSVLVAKELLYLTHTHIKNLINLFENRNFTNKRNAIQCLTNVTRLINQSYIRKSSGEWIRIRQTLLNYLNGSNCVIKVFLESKMQDKDGNIIIQKKNISELFGKTGMIYYFQPKKTEQLFTTNDYLNIVKATDTEFYMIENVKYNIGDNLFSKRKQCTEEKNKIKPIPENDSISESSVLSHMLRKTTIKHISFENILDISETSEKQSGDGFAFKLKETQKQKYEEIKPHILQNKNDSARKIREKFSFLETQQNEQLSEIKYDLTSSQDLINLMDNFENFEDD